MNAGITRLRPATAAGLLIVLFWAAMAAFGPLLAPHADGGVMSAQVFDAASRAAPLGTDYLGRDMLTRILIGARYTVGVAAVATGLASLVGTTLALCAATVGGWTDAVLSRLLDALISLPSLLFALVVVASVGSSIPMLVATAAVIYVPGAYRTVRALAVNIVAMEFVKVARARGEGTLYLMRAEILPNIVLPVLTDFGLRFIYVVLLLSGLSFLGLGIQPPYADWGSLVRENIEGLAYGAPAVIMPALAIATLTIGVNLLVDGLAGRRGGGDGR
ncbi:MAG: DNA-directed RNA polymerase subunit alpha [Rhodospirillales bacterium 70-18]|nr:ABC transporter permease [Rhodospirillales bacterium]OJY71801.1 MAG: DNA-directed RNA polymerase subunit alpha [Rhodospirillales bacterium 70-18]